MGCPDGETEDERLVASDADAGEEAAQRVDADEVVLLGGDGGGEGVAPGEDGGADAAAGGEDGVGGRGAEVGEARIAVHGGCDEEVWVGGVGGGDGEDVGWVDVLVEPGYGG